MITMQNLIVAIVIIAAAAYVGWTYYRKFKTGKAGSNACGCGCDGCETAATCPSSDKPS